MNGVTAWNNGNNQSGKYLRWYRSGSGTAKNYVYALQDGYYRVGGSTTPTYYTAGTAIYNAAAWNTTILVAWFQADN